MIQDPRVQIGTWVKTHREYCELPTGTVGIVDELYPGGFTVAWFLEGEPAPSGTASTNRERGILRDGFAYHELKDLEIIPRR